MTLKKLHENRPLYFVLNNSKPGLRKAKMKQGIDNELANILSKLCFNLTEGNVQLSEVVKQRIKQYLSRVRMQYTCPRKQKWVK